jgi:hypothetical protein
MQTANKDEYARLFGLTVHHAAIEALKSLHAEMRDPPKGKDYSSEDDQLSLFKKLLEEETLPRHCCVPHRGQKDVHVFTYMASLGFCEVCWFLLMNRATSPSNPLRHVNGREGESSLDTRAKVKEAVTARTPQKLFNLAWDCKEWLTTTLSSNISDLRITMRRAWFITEETWNEVYLIRSGPPRKRKAKSEEEEEEEREEEDDGDNDDEPLKRRKKKQHEHEKKKKRPHKKAKRANDADSEEVLPAPEKKKRMEKRNDSDKRLRQTTITEIRGNKDKGKAKAKDFPTPQDKELHRIRTEFAAINARSAERKRKEEEEKARQKRDEEIEKKQRELDFGSKWEK